MRTSMDRRATIILCQKYHRVVSNPSNITPIRDRLVILIDGIWAL
jgi:hypothetical protein